MKKGREKEKAAYSSTISPFLRSDNIVIGRQTKFVKSILRAVNSRLLITRQMNAQHVFQSKLSTKLIFARNIGTGDHQTISFFFKLLCIVGARNDSNICKFSSTNDNSNVLFFFPSLFSNYSFKEKRANNYIRTRSYGRGPCQPIVEAAVAIVQPKFVLGARQPVLELYHVAYVDGGYGGVGWWITDSRAVVQTVPRTSLAQVSWYLDREVCRIRDLKT